MKEVENDKRTGRNKSLQLWFPITPPEKTKDTLDIGYGHKLKTKKEQEHYKRGVSDEVIECLLEYDLITHAQRAKEIMNNQIKDNCGNSMNVWDFLSTEQKEMATDFEFNGVLKLYKKFRHGLVCGDLEKIKDRGRRQFTNKSGQLEFLRRRNRLFFERYKKPKFGKPKKNDGLYKAYCSQAEPEASPGMYTFLLTLCFPV